LPSDERTTRQQQAILKAFQDQRRPLSAQEAYDSARVHEPRLGIATVYRVIKRLSDRGELMPVVLPGEASRYELPKHHHHHFFQCTRCEQVFDIEGCVSGLKTMLPEGFELDRHEILLYGRCPDCAGVEPADPAPGD